MGKSKTLALAVSAIRNLKELRGSTSQDIVNYITRACRVDEDAVRKKVKASLRRGVAYGYLKRENGCYTFPLETEGAAREIAAQEIGLMETCAKKRGKRILRKNGRSRKSNSCKWCGRICPCAGTNRCRNKNANYASLGQKLGEKTRINNIEKLFGSRSFKDLKTRRNGNRAC